ncbi:hypothetical protein [Nocardia sp. NPDC004711]
MDFVESAHADVAPLADEHVPSSPNGLRGKVVHGIFTTARQNHTNAEEYREALIAAGFEDVGVYSIRHHVFPQYAEFVSNRSRQPETKRINPLTRMFFGSRGVSFRAPWLDYIVAVAEKPSV